MAVSNSHKFGQIIGDSLEMAMEPFLRNFACRMGFYLDKKGIRKARPGKKVTWRDINNNRHDLDFVMEKGGTEECVGRPIAFIECAWRRYTKHSRNKAQEIQGAIIPLRERYKNDNPFIGVVLAGVFTQDSIIQLESLGFSILFIPYETIIAAFKRVKICVRYDETTDESFFAAEIEKWNQLTPRQKNTIYRTIAKKSESEIHSFILSLENKLTREIIQIRLWTLYGTRFVFASLEAMEKFVQEHEPQKLVLEGTEFCRYEAEIDYSNGDTIKMNFSDKDNILSFLSCLKTSENLKE